MSRIPELIDKVVRLAAEKGVPIDPDASPLAKSLLDAYIDYFPEPMPAQLLEFYQHWLFEGGRPSTSGTAYLFRESLCAWHPRQLMPVPFDPSLRVNESPEFNYAVEVGLVPGDLFAFPWLTVDHAAGTVHRNGSVWLWDMSGDAWCPLRVAGSIEEFLADEAEGLRDPSVRWSDTYSCLVVDDDDNMRVFSRRPPISEAEVLALLRDEEQ